MAQYAVTVIPAGSYVSGNITGTTSTGSMYIGNLLGGVRPWNDTLFVDTGTPTPSYFYASPIANINNAAPYVFGLPFGQNPQPVPYSPQPQFIYSQINGTPTLSDAAFIATANYLLQNYHQNGYPDPNFPCNPAGCGAVRPCQNAIDTCGWFQSYGFTPP